MTTMEAVVAIIIAIFGSTGLWAFIANLIDRKSARNVQRNQDVQAIKISTERISNDLLAVRDEVTKLNNDIENINKTLQETNALALATARDRVNFLTNKYEGQGYIDSYNYVAYKLIGKAYIENGGNSEVAEKYNAAIEHLDVR